LDKEDPGRRGAIESASLIAAEIPLDLVSRAHEISLLHKEINGNHNKNAQSDLMASKHLLATASVIGAYNVAANLPEISNQKRLSIKSKLSTMMEEIENMLSITLDWSES
jgi:formiminotetrahydrofolate cyclodeaminase